MSKKIKKCLIIVNTQSGNSNLASPQALKDVMGTGFAVDFLYLQPGTLLPKMDSYDRIVVCGGDGTLHSVVNRKIDKATEIIYFPFGTLNECATGNSNKGDYAFDYVGEANHHRFTYVCACGTFTPLGYAVKDKYKKHFKSLAYLSKVFSQYKAQFINAKIKTNDGTTEEGLYTLIMAIKSPKCFGFNFNKMFKSDNGKMHLLAIKSPKHGGFKGAFKMFFPLFRAFFIGFKREYHSKNMIFKEFTDLKITLNKETGFCMDGELVLMDGTIDIKPVRSHASIRVISAVTFGEYVKNGIKL